MEKLEKPNLNKLRLCMKLLAKAMDIEQLPPARFDALVAHILYDEKLAGIDGKNALEGFKHHLITEREYRNLVLAHFSTKLANHNRVTEPDFDSYIDEATY